MIDDNFLKLNFNNEYELLNDSLTIIALYEGVEKLTIRLGEVSAVLKITVGNPVPEFSDINVSYDLAEKESCEVTFTVKNSNGYEKFIYSLKQEEENVKIEDNKMTISFDDVCQKEIIVLVNYKKDLFVDFKVVVEVINSNQTPNQVPNGSFNDGLNGWVLDGEKIATISDASTYWFQEYAMNNVGNYFSAYGEDGLEVNQGTLSSSKFLLSGSGYISFMFGGAGNEECYITVEDLEGNVLALYRNTKFRDFTPEEDALSIEEKREMIGKTIFLCNLVSYKADLSEHIGKELKVVVHDHASSGWGVVYFDELKTFHPTVDDINNYELAVNELANKESLEQLIENEILEQGDYTTDSFNAYKDAINNAKEVYNSISIKQSKVDELVQAINTAITNLEVREILVKENTTNFKVIVEETFTLNICDYFDVNGLDDITYNAVSDETITVSENKLSYLAGKLGSFTITLQVLYKGEVSKTVEVTIEVTEDRNPIVKNAEIIEIIDAYSYEKEVYEFDLASNINNIANLELTYYVNDEELSSSLYTHQLDNTGSFELSVKIAYQLNGETKYVEFLLKLNLKDTSIYRLYNGDFELGTLEGWVKVGKLGNVTDETNYWYNDPENANGYEFGKEGNYLFSGYAEDVESAYGTLTSSKFIVGGSGFITYKLGAAKHINEVCLQVVDAQTHDILKVFGNPLWADRTNDIKSGCTLIPYKADISDLMGKEVYIRVVDNGVRDYGIFFLDSVITYYNSEPSDDFNLTESLEVNTNIYDMLNGNFETGDLTGWNLISGEVPGKVTDLNGFWPQNVLYDKEGKYLFSGLEGQNPETDPNLEYRKGVLRSNVVVLKENSILTFKLGSAKNSTTGIRIVDAASGDVIASFYNTEFQKHDFNEGRLMQYVYEFNNSEEITCYVEIFDELENDWGLISIDNIVLNAESKELENSFVAVNQITK